MDICLIEGCRKPAKNRGLCGACSKLAHKAVRNSAVTWEELETYGLARAPRMPLFERQLAKKQAEKKLRPRGRRPRLTLRTTVEPDSTSPGGASTTSDAEAQDQGFASF